MAKKAPVDTFEKEIRRLAKQGVPAALAKASIDSFTYALKLRTGEVIIFQSATISDDAEWAHLTQIDSCRPDELNSSKDNPAHKFNFERGLDVRVSDIVWIADAPWGS